MAEPLSSHVDPLAGMRPALLEDVRRRYAEPQRFYHDWRHIEELLRLFVEIRGRLAQPEAVLCAILYHDAVYDPQRSDNEARSAELLVARASADFEPLAIQRARRLVEATARHEIPADVADGERADAALFLDMDLAILGAPAERFDEYERQIRREYAHVPEEQFRVGRTRVLRTFLARETLFLSDWGRGRFDQAARSNMRRSLDRLEQAGS
jgi:predicted metal-dependent HD superfamily phosphohydrolase